LYQDRYLPRKFKIAIAIPPNNDVDVFGNDLGLIAIIENNQLKGYNIAIGGGLSSPMEIPLLPETGNSDWLCQWRRKILKTVYEIVTIQRDYGNRSDRSLARLKYTVDKMGVDWFKSEISRRTGLHWRRKSPSIHRP
jgi:sulfite reductase (NADPH) hemoprotein beta-component